MSSRTIIQDYDKYLSKVNPEKGRRRAQEQEAKWAEERKKREQEKLTEAYQKELRARTEQAARERRKVEKATAAFNAEQERKGTRSNQMNRRELRQIREGVSNIANPTLPFKSPDELMARAIQANEIRKETLPFKPVSQNRVSETGSLAGFPRVERTSNINQGLFQPTGDIIANNRAIDNLTVRQPKYREEKKLPEVKPSDRYNNQNIRTEQKKSKRDTRFDSDFDRFYEYRYEKADFTDYDPKTDTTVEHWRNLKEEIKKKNKWSDKEFEDRWKAYDKERAQQAADSEVQTALDIAEKHPVLGTLLQAAYTPQGMIEGAASALSNLLPDEFKAQSADDPLFTGTRSKEGIRQTVKDEHINSDLGRGAYDLATGLGDMLLAQGIPVLGTAALGGNAAANTNMQALERGVDPNSAAKTGAVAGVASGLLNRVGLDAALGSEASTALRTIGKAALKEGAENVLEDVTNLTADKLINKDMSQLNTLHDYYVGQGMSDDDAWKRAALDTAKNLGLSAATGAAFGGLMSAAGNIPRLKADFTASRTPEQPIDIPKVEEPTIKEVEKAVPKQTIEALGDTTKATSAPISNNRGSSPTEGYGSSGTIPNTISSVENSSSPNLKVSDAYENSMKNSGIMTDEELARHTVPENFTFESKNEIQTMAEGARMREAEGEDFVPNRLNKEGFTASDTDGMMQAWRDKVAEARALDEAGEDSALDWDEANIIFRKIQQEASRNGAALQALAKWTRNTPEGMLSEAENIVNKRIEVSTGKDKLPKKVKDKINTEMDKAAVAKQKPVLTKAVDAYRDYVDRIVGTMNTSDYEGSAKNIQKLKDSISNFESALDEGNINHIQETYSALKRRAKSMSKKGLTIEVENKDVEDAIKTLVKNSKAGGFKFSSDFQKRFINDASQIQNLEPNTRDFKEAYAKLGVMVNDEIRRNTSMPKLAAQRLTSYLMNNMLGNFRTLITRNAGGNLGLAAVEQFMERPLAAGIDKLVAKKTGMRTQGGLSIPALKDYASGFKKGLVEEAQDVKSGLHTSRSGEVNLADAISRNTHVFKTDSKNKLLKAASKAAGFKNEVVAHGLSVGDRPFYEAIYNQTLGDLNRLKEKGQLGAAVQNLSEAEFKELSDAIAGVNALTAVYQNDSKMANALMGFKKSIGELSEGALGFDILSQFSMPFVKTPANVVDRAIDYSPLGLIRNAARTGKETLGKNAPGLNQNRFVNETARNIIGTGLMAGAGAAAYNGAMSGKYSKDKDEKAAQKEAGEQEYALNIPGRIFNLPDNYQMDIGWIPVLGSNSVAAAAAVDAAKDPEMSRLDKVLAGTKAGGKAMLDQSMFQGLQRLFGQGDTYDSDEGIVGNMINTVKQGTTQAIPSLARQIAQVADPYERDLNNGNYDINSIKNTIPIVRETLQPKVDSEGNYILQNQGRGVGSKIAENMILPGKITKIQPREMNTEAQRLQSETGNNYAYIPKVLRSEITTDDHTPTDKEYTDYQVDRNKSMSDAGKIMMNTNYYKSASPEEQEMLLKEVYENVKAGKRAEYTGKESTDNLVKLYNDNGHKKDDPKLLVRRMVQGEQIEQAGFNKTDKLYEYMDKGGNINDYKKFIDSVTHTTESGSKSIYKDDYMEAISKLPEKQRKLISDAKGVNFSDEEQAAYDKNGIDGALKVWQKNKREKEKKAREKEKKLKQAAREAGVSPRALDRLQGELASYGATDSPTTVYYYNHARAVYPNMSTKAYANKLRQYGGEDMKITKKELIAAANKEGWSQAEMEQNFRAFGEWKTPAKYVNGTWK